MAVLHLQFVIDSEVHPELYQMLCSIDGSLSQAERLRQLAATGLVWERLRLQAYGPIEVPDLGPATTRVPVHAAALPARAATASAAAAPAVPQVDPTPAEGGDLADFVDLSDAGDLVQPQRPDPGPTGDRLFEAHDADHGGAPADTVDRAVQIAAALILHRGDAPEMLPLHEIRSAVQELPVLTEVVGAGDLPNLDAIAATANETTPSAAHAGRGGSMLTSAQIHELAPARKTATRSRLLRMKEKGLFKNE